MSFADGPLPNEYFVRVPARIVKPFDPTQQRTQWKPAEQEQLMSALHEHVAGQIAAGEGVQVVYNWPGISLGELAFAADITLALRAPSAQAAMIRAHGLTKAVATAVSTTSVWVEPHGQHMMEVTPGRETQDRTRMTFVDASHLQASQTPQTLGEGYSQPLRDAMRALGQALVGSGAVDVSVAAVEESGGLLMVKGVFADPTTADESFREATTQAIPGAQPVASIVPPVPTKQSTLPASPLSPVRPVGAAPVAPADSVQRRLVRS